MLLDAIPTVVMLLLMYAIYQNLVREPLQRLLAHRRGTRRCQPGCYRSPRTGSQQQAMHKYERGIHFATVPRMCRPSVVDRRYRRRL